MSDRVTDAVIAFTQALADGSGPAVDWSSSVLSSLADTMTDAVSGTEPGTWLLLLAGALLFWSGFFRRV